VCVWVGWSGVGVDNCFASKLQFANFAWSWLFRSVQRICPQNKPVQLNCPGGPKQTSRNLCNYNGAYTSWGEISFGTFVDQYVLLLTYKFQ